MCKAGGPRCSNHALKALNKSKEKLIVAINNGDKESLKAIKLETTKNLLIWQSTPQGQKNLEEKITDADDGERQKLEQLLVKAKKMREKQIREGEVYRRNRLLDSEYQKDLPADVKREQRKMLDELTNIKKVNPNTYTSHSLNSPLKWEGEYPEWAQKQSETAQKMFGTKSEIIDTMKIEGKEVAVVWNENSIAKQDIAPQMNSGFKVSSISYVDMKTGETIGYVKTMAVDKESFTRSFGDDEHSTYRFLSENNNITMGRYESEEKDIDGVQWRKRTTVFPLEQATTQEEKLEALKETWAGTYKYLEIAPKSADMGKIRGLYNLGKNYAPEDEETLNKELAFAQTKLEQIKKEHFENHKHPHIDFSRLENSYKGKGLGTSMYVYLARKLGEKGQTLSGSGIQSDDAQRLWKGIINKKGLPVKVTTTKYKKKDYTSYSNRYTLDFR